MSQNENSQDIAHHRAAIDALDLQLVQLLNQRAGHAQAIGHAKGGAPAYRPEREAQVLDNARRANAGPLSDAAVSQVLVEVMSACRGLEQSLTVSYLGPQGTFSEMALYQHFGHAVEGMHCASIDEVFRSAESGSANFAVVPVENSTEGVIARTLDLLLSTGLIICGEIELRVHQNLMTRSGHRDGVKRVYSHPQSLAQCHGWLNAHLPGAERMPLSSNAEAARRASQEPDCAAIGPAIAADRYGLQIVDASIEDDSRNRTRFLVLGNRLPGASGRDRTSLVLSAHNRPGAVHDLIAAFAANGVSMSRIESRPARTGQWEYLFYIDIVGHQDDAPVAKALAEVAQKAPFMKIFGSYPAVF